MALANAGTVVTQQTDNTATAMTSGAFSPAAGSTILVHVYTRDEQSNDPTMVDSGTSLTWTLVVEVPTSGTASDGHTFVFSAFAASAPGSITVTATWDTASKAALVLTHSTGGDSTAQTDATGVNSNAGSAKSLSTSITTNQANSMIVSGAGSTLGFSDTQQPSGFTFRGSTAMGGSSADKANLAVADKILATAGTDNHTWNDTVLFHQDWRTVSVEVVEDNGGGGGAPATIRRALMSMGVGRMLAA